MFKNFENGRSRILKLITVHLTIPQQKYLELLVLKKLYPNKSEAIRCAINDLFELHQKDLS